MRPDHDAIKAPGPPAEGSGSARVGRGQLMIETLEEGLSHLSGDRVRVRSIRAEELRKGGSFAMHRLDVQLESGDVLPAVFKDLNPLRQLQNAKRIRRLELGRSRREIWMYWHVLPGLALGTPRLYGYRWEPKRGNLWLFVEDAGPHRLAHRGDLGLFEQAAAWVGRFHAATTGMASDERLLRYDRAHYERRGIDWETAATGPQYVDLVSISAGRWTRSQRMAMRRAYFDARHSPVPVSVDWRRFNEEVDVVAILQA